MNRRQLLRTGAFGMLAALTPVAPLASQASADSGSGLKQRRFNAWADDAPSAAATHPLDPLTTDEITLVVDVLKTAGYAGDGALFAMVRLQEPPKAQVLRFQPGDPLQREAFAVVYDRSGNRTSEAVVDLAASQVVSWQERPGAQPALMESDIEIVKDTVRGDPRWLSAMASRGITRTDTVAFDAWGPGDLPVPAPSGTRLSRVICFYGGDAENPYARPIEGVVVLVDLNAGQVLDVMDTGVVPLAGTADLNPQALAPLRAPPASLNIEQPDGPGFVVQGNAVSWQKWRFRFGLDPREGVVLRTVGYVDQGKLRSILYRAALSEMVVPYGDPDPTWAWRSAFDVGEYDMGRFTNSLIPGIHVPENARVYDAVLASDMGDVIEVPGAVAIYERDGGLLWQHYSEDLKTGEVRRARELVLHAQATVGNYDYGFNWIFRQDGSLEIEAELSGLLLAKGVLGASGHESYATNLGPHLAAPSHQHFFNFRLDFDVDGVENSVVEINSHGLPIGPDNPYGNLIVTEETVLSSSQQAQRDIDDDHHRFWRVFNPSLTNAHGQHPAYALIPGENAVPYLAPETATRRRAGFLDHHVWVTPYHPDQMYAAGDYPMRAPGGQGLPEWSADDAPVQDTDVVVWYTFGVTHIPRVEDWPVMPAERAGFRLLPFGFFDQNPALDVPPPSA